MRCLFPIQPDSAVILTMANVGVASMIFAKKDANKSLSTKTHLQLVELYGVKFPVSSLMALIRTFPNCPGERQNPVASHDLS